MPARGDGAWFEGGLDRWAEGWTITQIARWAGVKPSNVSRMFQRKGVHTKREVFDRTTLNEFRLRELAAAGHRVAVIAELMDAPYNPVYLRMRELGIARQCCGRPKALPQKDLTRGPMRRVPPQGMTHRPCGACAVLIDVQDGCEHWKPTVAQQGFRGEEARRIRNAAYKRAQREKEAAAKAKAKAAVAEFRRQQGVGEAK